MLDENSKEYKELKDWFKENDGKVADIKFQAGLCPEGVTSDMVRDFLDAVKGKNHTKRIFEKRKSVTITPIK